MTWHFSMQTTHLKAVATTKLPEKLILYPALDHKVTVGPVNILSPTLWQLNNLWLCDLSKFLFDQSYTKSIPIKQQLKFHITHS